MGKKPAPTSKSNDARAAEALTADTYADARPSGKLSCFFGGLTFGVAACGVLLVALQQFDPILLSTLVVPASSSACPACPSPEIDTPTLKSRVQELRGKLDVEKASLAACEKKAEELARLELEKKDEEKQVEQPVWLGGAWPECKAEVVLAHTGEVAILEDLVTLFGTAVDGCRMDDCTASDTFRTSRPEDCAHACSRLEQCSFWTHGEEECRLLAIGAGEVKHKPGYVSAPKACAPLPTTFTRAQAVLAVLDSELLRSCDGGETSDSCPDLKNAMRTWFYAIETLRRMEVAEGLTHPYAEYIEQIYTDTRDFNEVSDVAYQRQMYPIAAGNNRQVLGALRTFILQLPTNGSSDTISRLDISLPDPVRGLLCQNSCPEIE